MANSKVKYKEIIAEINDEISEGVLTLNDTIQILRDTTPIYEGYCTIVEWYYDDFTMKQELETPLEEMYMEDEFSKEEWKAMLEDQKVMKAQYETDKPKLISMKVKDVLTEMKQIQKLF